MPSHTTAKLPMSKSWDEFENICADVIKKIWKDDYIIHNGCSGQKQNGVDIYGKPVRYNGDYCGVQCKNKKTDLSEIKEEVSKAESFKPELKELIFMIGSSRDAKLQEDIRILDTERVKKKNFSVTALFWDDICLSLASYPELMEKYFPQFVEKPSSLKSIVEKIMTSTIKDWIFTDEGRTYTFKKDTNLTIVRDVWKNRREFKDPWVEKFSDKNAVTSYHTILYNSNLIKNMFFVAVDGYRMYIPVPKHDMTINKFQYQVGKIINEGYGIVGSRFGTYDSYLSLAGIVVTKEMPDISDIY